MVEFVNGVKGIALNLENESVWIVVFGSDTAIKEGDLVKRTGSIMDIPARKVMLGRMVGALEAPIDGRGAFSDHERRCIKVKALGIIERKSGHDPMKIGLKAVDSLVPIGVRALLARIFETTFGFFYNPKGLILVRRVLQTRFEDSRTQTLLFSLFLQIIKNKTDLIQNATCNPKSCFVYYLEEHCKKLDSFEDELNEQE
ncbi:ATPase subunit 1 [Cucumis melo var. makuwa]|uniref:ATPase subunit 1 (Mitochondrion) n=2 Tax=Cucumis melo TaxID=3656 RepID=A0A5A7UCL8_CUCMM|nr:ATPase subunit 1 [Cucumis melo var. makuwa]TYK12214.1 ATPase subunit 1 [Cucumis melo var. makuwa]